jgi:hypothetical protein
MAREIDATMIVAAHREWSDARNGQKTIILGQWCDALGLYPEGLYKRFRESGLLVPQREVRSDKGVEKIPGMLAAARTIAHLYALIPRRAGRKPSVDYVFQKALINGLIPWELKDISTGNITRILREQKLLDQEGRVLRFEARAPMEQVQIDASGSEYLYPVRQEGSEWILRPRSSKAYKNKDKFEQMKLWYVGVVDDHSRYWMALPFVSPGESGAMVLSFIKWAIAKKEDPRIIMRGLWGRVYCDNGALVRNDATRTFLESLGIEIKTHEPDSPSDTGKIEIKWKQLWSGFEVGEFIMDPHWESREYTLTEVRERLMNYTKVLNERRHPTMATVTKTQAWLKVMHQGGVIDVDASVFDNAFSRHRHLVGSDGIFQHENVRYRVYGLLNTWVYAYFGLYNKGVVVEDMLTHQRYEADVYTMPGLDEIRTDRRPVADTIRLEAQELKQKFLPGEFKSVYENQESGVSSQESGVKSKVVYMLVRSREKRTVENVFDVDRFASIEQAMAEVHGITGRLSDEEREVIQAAIVGKQLDKQFARDLAMEVRGAIEAQREQQVWAV